MRKGTFFDEETHMWTNYELGIVMTDEMYNQLQDHPEIIKRKKGISDSTKKEYANIHNDLIRYGKF